MQYVQEYHEVGRQMAQKLEEYMQLSGTEIKSVLEMAGDYFEKFTKARQRCKDITDKTEIAKKFMESWRGAVESLEWSYQCFVEKLKGELLQS